MVPSLLIFPMALPRPVRKIFFWLHLTGGLTAGLFILLMATTGFLLTYERQILDWQDGYHLPLPQEARTQSLESLVTKVILAHAKAPAPTILVEEGFGEPIAFALGKEKTIYVNPHTGQMLGEGSPRSRAFFSFVTGLHRWLALEGTQRDTGKAITGAACLFFTFLVISGLIIWWPRHWSWISLKRILLFQPRLHGPARDWNWHNVIGFWCCVPLLIITLSGLTIAYPWATNLLYRIAGSEPPPPKTASAGGGKGRTAPSPAPTSFAGLDQAFNIAKDKVPGWESMLIRLPSDAQAPATFTISESHRGRPDKKTQLMVKLATGEVAGWEPFSSYSRGKQWRFWTRWLHTGEAGGFLGQTLAGASALGAIFLVWTGFALSWRRLTKWRGRTVR